MDNYIFSVPDIGEGTAVVELVAWHVKTGDVVEEDQPLAEVMTDKATVEISSPVSGRVARQHGGVGEELAVGSPFVEFSLSASVVSASESEEAAAPEASANPPIADASQSTTEFRSPHPSAPRISERPSASPAVRHRAKELGIALEDVRGSGPSGRIRHCDIEAYLAYQPQAGSGRYAGSAKGVAAETVATEYSDVALAGLRRKIAQKMELSSRTIPHFAYIEEIDLTELEATRERLNSYYGTARPKLTLLPFFIVALCRVLPNFPQMNAHYLEDNSVARQFNAVHVGVAAQTPSGLMVPVVRNAQSLGLWSLAGEISRLATAARDGSAKRDELSGSTISVTSLGKLGGIATTPVINHPEVAILGPNRLIERPVLVDNAIAMRKLMNFSSSFDHRVVDGQDAARFIQEIKSLLEEPAALLAY